jgi:polyphosphate glucokinase
MNGLREMGKKKWRRHVDDVVTRLKAALEAEYVVIGGGNVKLLEELPDGARLGNNQHAFHGGARLWEPQWAYLIWARPRA